MFTPEEASVDMPSYITDVPRLESDGTGRIEVTTGDLAVPCVGVFLPGRKQAVFVFTVQSLDGQNIGIRERNRGTDMACTAYVFVPLAAHGPESGAVAQSAGRNPGKDLTRGV